MALFTHLRGLRVCSLGMSSTTSSPIPFCWSCIFSWPKTPDPFGDQRAETVPKISKYAVAFESYSPREILFSNAVKRLQNDRIFPNPYQPKCNPWATGNCPEFMRCAVNLTLSAISSHCCCCTWSERVDARTRTGRDRITKLGITGSGGTESAGLTVTATLSSLCASPLYTPRVGGTSA